MSYNDFSQQPKKKRGCLGGLLAALLVLVILAAVGLGVGEYVVRQKVHEEFASQLGVTAEELTTDFGKHSVLLAAVTKTVPYLHLTAPAALQYVETDGRTEVTGTPALDATLNDIDITHQDDPLVGTLTATVDLPDRLLTAQALQDQGDSFLTATQVDSNPSTGALDVAINNGLGTLSLTPEVHPDGSLTLRSEKIKVFGFTVPNSLLDALNANLNQRITIDSALRLTDLHVVEDGVTVTVSGTDVRVKQLQPN